MVSHARLSGRRLLTLALIALSTTAVAAASETGLTGREGHPRARLPLALNAAPLGEPALDAAVRKAVGDWNAVSEATLGVAAFRWIDDRSGADVVVEFERPSGGTLMGEARFSVDRAGAIELPVRVVVVEPQARGETSRETLLYQVVAHELGHSLGLAHVTDPRSVMCCDYGAIDFKNSAIRDAYVGARRHPDLASVTAQLVAHYERFWRRSP